MVQQALCEETGNVILLKDLSNVVNKRNKTSRNDLDVVVDLLMNKYGELVNDYTILLLLQLENAVHACINVVCFLSVYTITSKVRGLAIVTV